MNKFLIRLGCFLAIFAGCLLFSYAINSFLTSKFVYKSSPQTNMIFTGDSRTQLAINPIYFEKTENVALEGCPLFVNYFQIRHILDHNPAIETIVCSISPAQFSATIDDFISDRSKSKGVFQRTLPIADFDELSFLATDMEFFVVSAIKNIYTPNLHYWAGATNQLKGGEMKLPFIGAYQKADARILPDDYLSNLVWGLFGKNEEEYAISQVAIEHFNKIIELCEEQNIALICFSPPLAMDYTEKVPPFFEQNFQEIIQKLSEKGIEYHDFRNYFSDFSKFRDHHHLNTDGAAIFSKAFSNLLQQ